jgi:hypothetical protein
VEEEMKEGVAEDGPGAGSVLAQYLELLAELAEIDARLEALANEEVETREFAPGEQEAPPSEPDGGVESEEGGVRERATEAIVRMVDGQLAEELEGKDDGKAQRYLATVRPAADLDLPQAEECTINGGWNVEGVPSEEGGSTVEELALLDGELGDDVYVTMGSMAKVRSVLKAQRKRDKR